MTAPVNRTFKDSLFRSIFKEKTSLLSLYNAIRGSNYTDPEDLTINTLENVLYLSMKNDVSFIINNELNLFEAQSSWNPNMPLRGLLYFAQLYKGYLEEHQLNIYSYKLLQLPTPKFIVFYNGTKNDGDTRTFRLSDSFINNNGEEACLECTATMININYGHNQKLMNACRGLYEYSYLINQIRIGTTNNLPLPDAIEQAVHHCIQNNILKDFLTKNRAEVTNMILEEFDFQKYLRLEKEESYSDGHKIGVEEGQITERKRIAMLVQHLEASNRMDELSKALIDSDYLKCLFLEFNID